MNACYVIIIIYIYLLILDTATSDVIINSTPSSQQVLNHFIFTHARNHHRKTKLHSIMKIPLTTYKSKLILKVKTEDRIPLEKKVPEMKNYMGQVLLNSFLEIQRFRKSSPYSYGHHAQSRSYLLSSYKY